MLLSDLRSVRVLLLLLSVRTAVRRAPGGGGGTTRLRLLLRLASQRRVDTTERGRRRSSSRRTSRTGRVGLSGHLRRRERERTLTRRRRRRRRKVGRERKRRHRQPPLRRDRVATGDSAGSVRGVIGGGGRSIVTRSGGGVLHPTRRDIHLGRMSEVRRRGRGKVVRLERGGRVLTSMSVRRFRRVLRRSLARRGASCSSAELHAAHSVREVLLGRVRRGGARLPERSVHALVRRTTGSRSLERVRVPRLGRRGHGRHKVRVAERRRRRVGRLIRVQVRARIGTRNRFRGGGVHRGRRCRRRQTTETRSGCTLVRGRGGGGRRAQVASVRRRRRAVRRRIGGGGASTAIVTAIAFVFGVRRVCRDWQETRASRSAQRGFGQRGGRGRGRAHFHGGSRRVKVRRVGASASRGKVLNSRTRREATREKKA